MTAARTGFSRWEERKRFRLRKLIPVVLLALLAAGCGTNAPYYRFDHERPEPDTAPPAGSGAFSLFLIGDGGDARTDPLEPTLAALKHQLRQAGEHSAVIFLGDNIYTEGLPPAGHPDREDAERRIDTQLTILEHYRGRIIFIPGNHDWKEDKPEGYAAVLRQEAYIESHLQDSTVFLPGGGCPGPVEIELDSLNVLMVIDTQWWFYPHARPGLSRCRNGSPERFTGAIDSLVRLHEDKNLYIAGHHPMFSNGTHGGYFPAMDHIFPFLRLHDALYIPFPILGSIRPWYRKYRGNRQDMAGGRYRELRDQMIPIFQNHPRLVYAAGHDHSLQYHRAGGQHYLVSGSGTVDSYARRGKTADFVYSHNGFARIDIGREEVHLGFWIPGGDRPGGRNIYRTLLYEY